MAIFNLKYLEESYKSKYASYLNDDEEDSEDNKDADEKSPKSTDHKHLSKEEIRRVMTIVTGTLEDFKKLKKCCDYIDLSDRNNRDYINDDGVRESPYDKYYNNPGNSFIQLIDGDAYNGYPDFKSKGSDEFDSDVKEFVKSVNEKLESRGIKAKFSIGSEREEDGINFGLRSTKEK